MALNYPKDQGTEWFNLKKQVRDAFTSANSRVPYQKIAAGIVRISTSLEMLAGSFLKFFYESGDVGIFVGRHTANGGDSDGIYISRNGGGILFSSSTRESDNFGYTAIWDSESNIVVSDDATDKGLARPWLPQAFCVTDELTVPPTNRQNSTTSDLAIYTTFVPLQHPKLEYWAYVHVQNPGATAEVKFKNLTTGATMHSTTVGEGFFSNSFSVGTWDFSDWHQVDVTIRRASGTGYVALTLVQLVGRQS